MSRKWHISDEARREWQRQYHREYRRGLRRGPRWANYKRPTAPRLPKVELRADPVLAAMPYGVPAEFQQFSRMRWAS